MRCLPGGGCSQGETVSDTLAAVLTREPEWNRVPPRPSVCCAAASKEIPNNGCGISATLDFCWRMVRPNHPRALSASSAVENRCRRVGDLLAGRLVLSVDVDAPRRATRAATQRRPWRKCGTFTPHGRLMALSPDGSRLVFVTGQRHKSQLALRRLDQAKAVPLAGTDGAEAPFFSPDGKSIAFFADGKLKKMDAAGGAPVTLCDAPSSA